MDRWREGVLDFAEIQIHIIVADSKKTISVQRAAVFIGIGLMLLKFFAWYITNSNTILTDALESIVNVVAGGMAWYGVTISSMPRDHDHPYGHGKIEFIISGFEGGLIAIAGIGMIAKSAADFQSEKTIEHLDYGLAIITFSGLVNYLTGWWLIKVGRQENSVVLEADGKHLQSDAYTSIGTIAGLGLVLVTGIGSLDNIVAMVIGAWLCYIGYGILRRAFGGIMDEADMNLVEEITQLFNDNRKTLWIDVHNLRVIQYGNRLHIDCHVTMPFYMNLEETHCEMEKISSMLNEYFGERAEIFIHPDPCIETSCSICKIENCPARKHPFSNTITWNKTNITSNEKHKL